MANNGRTRLTATNSSFRIVPGAPESVVVIHVPHAATQIPDWVRAHILLDDPQLHHELQLMTDAHTDEIALTAADSAAIRPWLFINQLSRLVIDPERFPDPDLEPMAVPEIGMGPVYTRTANGDLLRAPDPTHERALLDAYFHPYAAALASLIGERLDAVQHVTIIDLHSFPVDELPYERHHHADAARPPLCIGTDDFHTPATLTAAVEQSFAPLGDIAINAPFAGTYVPLDRYHRDEQVRSVMVELRRDTYLNSNDERRAVAIMLTNLVNTAQQAP